MQSVIILSKDKGKIQKELDKIILGNKIYKFDVEKIQTEKTVGIETIRNLQKKIFLKPFKGDKKIVILESFLGITIEAQNAFLKILEEPPLSTTIVISSNSLDFFLPTILSRCTVINLDKSEKLKDETYEENLQVLKELKKGSTSYALKISQDNGKGREEALFLLEGLIITADQLLKNNDDFSLGEIKNILKSIQKTHTIIKTTNVAPRFALENLFLNLY